MSVTQKYALIEKSNNELKKKTTERKIERYNVHASWWIFIFRFSFCSYTKMSCKNGFHGMLMRYWKKANNESNLLKKKIIIRKFHSLFQMISNAKVKPIIFQLDLLGSPKHHRFSFYTIFIFSNWSHTYSSDIAAKHLIYNSPFF